MADVVDHPLSDEELGQLGQTPRRKRQTVIGRTRQSDLLDRWRCGRVKVGGPATGVLRVQRVEAVLVEVVDHLPHPVRAGESQLGDPGHVHTLHRQQHHLRPPPRHHRPRRTAHDPQQPVPLIVRDLPNPQTFPRHHPPPIRHQQCPIRLRDQHPQMVDLQGQHCADAALGQHVRFRGRSGSGLPGWRAQFERRPAGSATVAMRP